MSLYEGAVKKPIMTSLCFLAVAIFGLFSLSKLPVDLYPEYAELCQQPETYYFQIFRKHFCDYTGV